MRRSSNGQNTAPTARSHTPRALLGAAAIAVFLAAGSLPYQSSAGAAIIPLTPQTILPPTGIVVGPTDPQRTLQLSVALRANDPDALQSFIDQLYDPASSTYQQYLTPAEFSSRFIDANARARVDAFLQSAGLAVQDSGLGSIVSASGTVAQVESAFHVQISDYRGTSGGMFYANDRTPALPITIAGAIQTIAGLDNLPAAVPQFLRPRFSPHSGPVPATASGCTAALNAISDWGEGYTPNQFITAYNFSGVGNTGAGQTVALYELDNYLDSNVASYQSCFGTAVPLQRVLVSETSAPTPGGGEGEVELDIDVIVGLASHITKLLVYEAPNTGAAALAEYQKIANDNTAKVVSSSWDLCEPLNTSSQANAENTIYAQMATQGQSLFDASGDTGSAGCQRSDTTTRIAVDTTAASPNVTGVGGTTLNLTSSNAIASETPWNDFSTQNGAGGGGVSTFFSRPSYQTGTGTTRYSTTKRQVPDVAADADVNTAYLVFTHDTTNCPFINGTTNCFEPIGGTSAATPLWAAGMAEINTFLAAHGEPVVGLANPALYDIFRSSSHAAALHDITTGNNCYIAQSPPASTDCGTPGSSTGLYQASTGYDPVTGVGTPNFGGLATALGTVKRPAVTLTSSVNPSTSGQAVTFTAQVSTTIVPNPLKSTDTVTFKDGTTTLGTVALGSTCTATSTSCSASFNSSSLTAGAHSISAVFTPTASASSPAAVASATSNTVTQQVNSGTSSATTTTLSAAPTSAAVAQAVVLTAHVTSSGGTPTGTVTFKDGATALGTVTLSSGAAGFGASFTVPGTHALTAVYTPSSSTFLTSTSSTLLYVVYGPIVPHGRRITATRGTALAATTVIGGFTDSKPGMAAGNYRATIDWGDGSAVTLGTVAGSAGNFTITASHTYATTLTAGTYPINVTIGVTDGRFTYLSSLAQVS